MPVHLEPGPDNVHWGYFHADLSPRLAIDSGERVTISSVSGGPELMPAAPLDELVADESQDVSAFGEEAADLFDFDFSF